MGAFAELETALDATVAEREALDGQYADQRASIESQYELAETQQERDALQDVMDRLDFQRREAIEQLGRGYDQARNDILERAERSTGTGREQLEQLAGVFEQTYAQVGGAEQQAAANSSMRGIPVNHAGAPQTGVGAAVAREGAGIAAAEQMRNATTTEGIEWLADLMLGQRQAAIGDAGRTATRVGGNLQGQHMQRVSDRINQERMLQNQAFQDLDARFDTRRDGLIGQQGQLANQLAMIREQQRQADQQAALQREQMALQRSLAGRGGGGGGGRAGGGGGGGAGGPMAAGANFDSLEDFYRNQDSAGDRRLTATQLLRSVGMPSGGAASVSDGAQGAAGTGGTRTAQRAVGTQGQSLLR